MKNIKPYNPFNTNKSTSHNYIIDWTLFEGDIEYDELTEKLHVVYSEHGKSERMKDFKIEPWEIEDIIAKASDKLIEIYNKSSQSQRQHFTLRDRSVEYPFELIVIYDNDKYQTVVKTNIAIVGELYSADKVEFLKDQKSMRRLVPKDPDISFLNKVDNMEKNHNLKIEPGDFVFQVITTRRKRNFLINKEKTPLTRILQVYPDGAIEVPS